MANSTKVKATFKGKNGSMGFQSGTEYILKLSKKTDGELLANEINGIGSCDYSSFITFLNNWGKITSFKD